MTSLLRGMILMAAVVVAAPARAADGKAAPPASPQDRATLVQVGEVTGLLKKIDPTDKSFTLEIDMVELRGRLPAGTATRHTGQQAARLGQQEAHLLIQEEQALQTRSPTKRLEKLDKVAVEAEKLREKEQAQQEKQRLQQEAQKLRQAQKALQAGKPGVSAHMQPAGFDLGSSPDVKVRRLEPPVRYTKTGKVKKYTAKQLKELKAPDPDLIGYHAQFSDLRPGQVVQVVLTAPKDRKPPGARPVAGLIVIVEDAPEAVAANGKNK